MPTKHYFFKNDCLEEEATGFSLDVLGYYLLPIYYKALKYHNDLCDEDDKYIIKEKNHEIFSLIRPNDNYYGLFQSLFEKVDSYYNHTYGYEIIREYSKFDRTDFKPLIESQENLLLTLKGLNFVKELNTITEAINKLEKIIAYGKEILSVIEEMEELA